MTTGSCRTVKADYSRCSWAPVRSKNSLTFIVAHYAVSLYLVVLTFPLHLATTVE